ncbi:hypothetical protein B0H16DRAFT_211337 [Mycena metata]|uniref:Uncharacterized protein n=1 Tax=Mycena metata TaxID=1033252 RepID=A0AAD7GJI3_9AGAR|nr:hypothetical protein B0H16DRAFT_818420 [Mycena metata]KAJ7730465.1 hypothetical protein B0H16DRAFT_211337 [Mycena metata]
MLLLATEWRARRECTMLAAVGRAHFSWAGGGSGGLRSRVGWGAGTCRLRAVRQRGERVRTLPRSCQLARACSLNARSPRVCVGVSKLVGQLCGSSWRAGGLACCALSSGRALLGARGEEDEGRGGAAFFSRGCTQSGGVGVRFAVAREELKGGVYRLSIARQAGGAAFGERGRDLKEAVVPAVSATFGVHEDPCTEMCVVSRGLDDTLPQGELHALLPVMGRSCLSGGESRPAVVASRVGGGNAAWSWSCRSGDGLGCLFFFAVGHVPLDNSLFF